MLPFVGWQKHVLLSRFASIHLNAISNKRQVAVKYTSIDSGFSFALIVPPYAYSMQLYLPLQQSGHKHRLELNASAGIENRQLPCEYVSVEFMF